MKKCRFIPIKGKPGYYRCGNRGCTMETAYTPDPPERIHAVCEVQTEGPSNARRAVNFAVAAIKHLTAGSPTCTQEEIDARLELCQRCRFFNGEMCTHESCGCNVSAQKKYLNKLAWKDQKCPIGLWGGEPDELTASDSQESPAQSS